MPITFCKRAFGLFSTIFAVTLLGGCATTHNPDDPLESFNRGVYQFNDAADKAVIKPVASAYHAVVPKPARSAVSNFFSNLDDIVVVFNDLLQFKLEQAVSDSARVIFNSTFGLFGFIDIASDAGLEKHDEDFGQTLGYWGFNTGPYLVLPLLGPSNFRDGIGLAVDSQIDPIWQIDDISTRNKTIAAKATSVRSDTLDAGKVFEEAALDPYAFLRDAYLQRRRDQVYDGNPPRRPDQNNSGLEQEDGEPSISSTDTQGETSQSAAPIEENPQQTENLKVPTDTPVTNESESTDAEQEAESASESAATTAAILATPQVIRLWVPN